MNEEKKLLKSSEAAKFLGVSQRTIAYWVKVRKIVPDEVRKNNFRDYYYFSEENLKKFASLESSQMKTKLILKVNTCTPAEIVTRDKNKGDKLSKSEFKVGTSSQFSATKVIFPTPHGVEEINLVDGNCRKEGGHENELVIGNDMEKDSKVTVGDVKADEKESFELSTTRQIICTTDMLSRKIFSIPADKFSDVANGEVKTLTEKTSKGKKTVTQFWLKILEGYGEKLPLNEFDRDVLVACISAQQSGEPAITIDQIYKSISGKVDGKTHATAEMRDRIYWSAVRMMCMAIKIDMSGHEKLKGKGDKLVITSTVLPCMIVEGKVNGQDTTVIKFTVKSPLLAAAELRGQLLSYDAKLLNVSRMHNSADAITIKNYVLYEIESMKAGRRDNFNIRFDSIFETCKINTSTRDRRLDARKVAIKLLDSLKAVGEIRDYQVLKCSDFKDPRIVKGGDKIHAVKIDVEVKKKPVKNTRKLSQKKVNSECDFL